jgi:hypothetical protein
MSRTEGLAGANPAENSGLTLAVRSEMIEQIDLSLEIKEPLRL